MNYLELSGVCHVDGNLLFLFNMLSFCPNIRQPHEPGRKQGKIHTPQILSADLSTKSVDSFSLATTSVSLQLDHRIVTSQQDAPLDRNLEYPLWT